MVEVFYFAHNVNAQFHPSVVWTEGMSRPIVYFEPALSVVFVLPHQGSGGRPTFWHVLLGAGLEVHSQSSYRRSDLLARSVPDQRRGAGVDVADFEAVQQKAVMLNTQ